MTMTTKKKKRPKTKTPKVKKPKKQPTILSAAVAAREKARREREAYELAQSRLEPWQRDGWRPLAPGEKQEMDEISEDEMQMDRAQRTQHRYALLVRAIGGFLNTSDGYVDIYKGPGSRNRGR